MIADLRKPQPETQRAGDAPATVDVRSDARAVAFLQQNHAVAATLDESTILVRPEDAGSRAVLSHEYAHIAQLRSGRAASRRDAEAAAESIGAGSRQAPGGAAAPPMFQTATMTRVDFETTVKRRFGVVDIRTGTLADQQAEITRHGVTPNPGLTASMWQAWDPGSDSEIYRDVIDGILALDASFGGVPPIRHIIFYDTCYELDASGVAIPRADVGASYGAGTLTIYRRGGGAGARPGLPFARSVPSGTYAGAPVVTLAGTGTSPGAPIGLPTQRTAVMRTIEHELGHGLAEAALTPRGGTPAADPTMMSDYATAAGWFTAAPPQGLFDAGVQAVRTALASGARPPAQHEITVQHWNDPKWNEQPVSAYSIAGGPAEDFAEAVMVYVENPALLRARSPRRYDFLNRRKSVWQSQLSRPLP
jgi:hypothetical protein